MASAIFFGGRRINYPGAYSEIDASELAGVSPGAVGIVALVGTAEGGRPLTCDSEFADATRSGKILERYRSGNLRTAGVFAFEPSNDEAVPGGAQRVVGIKVNPATQSSAQLLDINGDPSVDLLSRDWGQFTEQINIEIAAGTTVGKLITIHFEGETETLDDVGGEGALNVDYSVVGGYDTVIGTVSATQFLASGTKDVNGLVTERTANIPAPGVLNVVSSSVGDTTQSLIAVGLDGLGVVVTDTIALNGTTPVQGTTVFTKIISTRLTAATAGTVTVSDFPVVTTLFTLAPAVLTRGIEDVSLLTAGSATVEVDTNSATDIVIEFLTTAGSTTYVRVSLATAGVTPELVAVPAGGATVVRIHLGDVPVARTVTYGANAFVSAHATFPTVSRLADYINTRSGFTATVLTSDLGMLVSTFDYLSAPIVAAPGTDFGADLMAVVNAINARSGYVSASRATGGVLVPANTTSPVYLSGGTEGTTTINEWREAFELLKKRRVNTIVPLTNDPAVHNLLLQHLRLRAGVLRSEANGYVGIGTGGGAGETKSNIKSQIRTLGSRHVSAVSQEGRRFDPDTGELTWYPPWMVAVVAAGMQAGSPVAEPLTFKRPLFTDVRQDSSWSPEDDFEEMIDSGLMFIENKDQVGIRWVRSITTHLADDNAVFSEMSANESANTAIYELRRGLELRIGKRGLVGSVAAIKGLANDLLSRLVDDNIIVAYRGLSVEQIGDVFPVSVELAPVLPINFIPITVHLVVARAAA